MAEVIEIDINAKDNTSSATNSAKINFQKLGREITGIGNSMTNIFTRPIMGLERLIMKNKEVQATLAPVQEAWQKLGDQLAVSLIPVIKELTPALISMANSLSQIVTWFSSLPIGVQESIVAFVGILAAIGPVLVVVGQTITAISSLGAAWTSISGILAPLASTVLPGIGAGLAAISAPVWLLIGAIALLGVTIAVFGQRAWQTITDIGKIFQTLWLLIQIKIDQIKKAWMSVDWGGIGKNIMQGITNGINSGIAWIINAARSAAQAALNAAKGLLGIRSPSTVFAGIGKNMMAGMAKGINNNSGMAVQATSKAVSATVPAATTAAQPASGINVTYSPMISLASQSEIDNVLLPLVRKAMRTA